MTTTPTAQTTLDAILAFVAKRYDLLADALLIKSRPAYLVEARQVLHYLARRTLPLQDAAIASHYNRDRSIIPYSVKEVKRRKVNQEFRNKLYKLEADLTEALKQNQNPQIGKEP